MSDTLHLLIPYAAGASEASQQALTGLALPHLDRLLARLTLHESDLGDDDAFSAPHERALARALGLPSAPGCIPWAAHHLHQQGRHDEAAQDAWAFVTPCHWEVRTDHVTLADPAQLQLTEDDSRALLALMAPWFEGDGITLQYDQPTRWLAHGELLADLLTASPERVLHRHVSHRLPGAALREGWAAWSAAWQAIDAGALARLDAHVARGATARLTLCGERGALTWHTAPRSLGQRISSIFRPQRFADVREQL